MNGTSLFLIHHEIFPIVCWLKTIRQLQEKLLQRHKQGEQTLLEVEI